MWSSFRARDCSLCRIRIAYGTTPHGADGCFIGSAYPLAGQCCHGETRAEVAGKLETIIEDLLDDPDWLKNVPEISTRENSGRITLRVSPEEHKLLAARSASRGLTINRYLKEKALG